MPPAGALVLPQVQVTSTSQEARLTAAGSQGLEGDGHTKAGMEREKKERWGRRGKARMKHAGQKGRRKKTDPERSDRVRAKKETGQQMKEERDTETQPEGGREVEKSKQTNKKREWERQKAPERKIRTDSKRGRRRAVVRARSAWAGRPQSGEVKAGGLKT